MKRLCAGLAAGLVIVFVDNVAFQGEVSPIVIVGLLLLVSAGAGFLWGWRGTSAAAAAWLCVPCAHLLKHVLGWPDTIHPNTYTSILLLAGFTLVVSALGLAGGVLLNRSVRAVRAG